MINTRTYYRNLNETDLLLYLKEGEGLAFDEIYERHWNRLVSDIYRRLKDHHQTEEIVQEVFVDLWNNRRRRSIDKLYPYLIQSARYRVYTLYRKQKTLPQFEEPLEFLAMADLQADSLVNNKDLVKAIQLWMKLQPEKRLEIFNLKFTDDKSTKEISELLGIAQKTVQNQILTSTNSLKDFLAKYMILMTLI